MSGIAGVICWDGGVVEAGVVERMTGAMRHRGPDGIEFWRSGGVALGQCQLRTTPESMGERQPLENEDGSVVLVMDGRVDNCAELRGELGRLRDESDAELVLRAYEEWGEGCAERVIGEFAFVIWDGRRRRVFGARDAVGVRHFYYWVGGGRLVFASEIGGVLASGLVRRELNEDRVLDFLEEAHDRDDEVGTFYRGVSRVPAGHVLVGDGAGGLGVRRYWDPAVLEPMRFRDLRECEEGFRAELERAVACRVRSSVRVGATLSGGMDSSSVAALAGRRVSGKLKTFSLVRERRGECVDWPYIEAMLAGGGYEGEVIGSEAGRGFAGRFLELCGRVDEPFLCSHGLVFWLLYGAARGAGCGVVLDGLAGDLLFCSMERSLRRRMRSWDVRGVVSDWGAQRFHFGAVDYGVAARCAAGVMAPEFVKRGWRRVRRGSGDGLVRRELAPSYWSREGGRGGESAVEEHAGTMKSGVISFAHENYGQIGFAEGVEGRGPFSDRRVMEYAIRMPFAAKAFGPMYKATMRNAMKGILPESVLLRREIAGHPGWTFYRALIEGIRAEAPELWCLARWQRALGAWVDEGRLRRVWDEFQGGDEDDAGIRLLGCLILTEWLKVEFGERFG